MTSITFRDARKFSSALFALFLILAARQWSEKHVVILVGSQSDAWTSFGQPFQSPGTAADCSWILYRRRGKRCYILLEKTGFSDSHRNSILIYYQSQLRNVIWALSCGLRSLIARMILILWDLSFWNIRFPCEFFRLRTKFRTTSFWWIRVFSRFWTSVPEYSHLSWRVLFPNQLSFSSHAARGLFFMEEDCKSWSRYAPVLKLKQSYSLPIVFLVNESRSRPHTVLRSPFRCGVVIVSRTIARKEESIGSRRER